MEHCVLLYYQKEAVSLHVCILSLCTCVYVSLCICIFIFHHLHLMTKIHSIKIWIPQNHCNAIVLLSKILNMCASEGSYSPTPPPPPLREKRNIGIPDQKPHTKEMIMKMPLFCYSKISGFWMLYWMGKGEKASIWWPKIHSIKMNPSKTLANAIVLLSKFLNMCAS